MSLRDDLQSIYQQYGQLTPRLVLDEARDEDHPLHSRFEWDDRIAAEAHRLNQAHELITSVKITYRRTDGSRSDVRAFHAMRSTDEDGDGGYEYLPAADIARDEILSALLLREMKRDIAALKSRWGHFQEFVALVREAVA